MFEFETVRPTQMPNLSISTCSPWAEHYDPVREDRNLWAACLITAIADVLNPRCMVQKSHKSYKAHKKEIQTESLGWILSDEFYIGSFTYCCKVCRIDPEKLRVRLLWLFANEPDKLRYELDYMHTITVKTHPTKEQENRGRKLSKCRLCGNTFATSVRAKKPVCLDCKVEINNRKFKRVRAGGKWQPLIDLQ